MDNANTEFFTKIENIKSSSEQERLLKSARVDQLKSQISLVAMTVFLLCFLGSVIFQAYWAVVLCFAAAAAYLYWVSSHFLYKSTLLYKDQDRRYAMACFQAAENADDMNVAGWFQYFPEMKIATNFNQQLSDEVAVNEIKRMRNVFSKKNSFEKRLSEYKLEIIKKKFLFQKMQGMLIFLMHRH